MIDTLLRCLTVSLILFIVSNLFAFIICIIDSLRTKLGMYFYVSIIWDWNKMLFLVCVFATIIFVFKELF